MKRGKILFPTGKNGATGGRTKNLSKQRVGSNGKHVKSSRPLKDGLKKMIEFNRDRVGGVIKKGESKVVNKSETGV